MKRKCLVSTVLLALAAAFGGPSLAGPLGLLGRHADEGKPSGEAVGGVTTQAYAGRDILVHVPPKLPPDGERSLVVVLHGGGGSAERIASGRSETPLNLNAVADKYGFVVAYLNGTDALRIPSRLLTWNAGGGCCGQSAARNVDDVAYITGAIAHLVGQYGVNRRRVYGVGHSNGSMMTSRVMCETDTYAAIVSFSGPLSSKTDNCPGARGKQVLAVHGADDRNVPLGGGKGSEGVSLVAFNSEADARQTFERSGATFVLDVVPGASHKMESIAAKLEEIEGISVADKTARFFGLGL